MRYRALIGAFLATGIAAGAHAQSTITIINNDSPGEGFNDPTSATPVVGNTGTTLGQQRLIAFQAAAEEWEAVIDSPVEIIVDAALDSLTPCNSSSGVLGRAGTVQVFRDFTNAPQANTWYSSALANAISGVDNDPAEADIQARFNSNVDNNNDCLNGTNWFYGIGAPTPANTISFFDTVKHELAHGLGVQSFVDIVTTGQLLDGRNDAFTNNLRDHATSTAWSAMTNAERLISSVNSGQLHWVGPQVNNCAGSILSTGTAGGHVRMFAPSPVQPGSSVSHFDTALDPDELMEPFATATSDQRLTDRLLADIGWNVSSPNCGIPHNTALSRIVGTHHPAVSPIVVHQPQTSPIHLPIGSFHSVLLSPRHVPVGSIHFPRGSLHQPVLSPGHQPRGSFHGPATSPHFPILSNPPHSIVGSRFGGLDPRIPNDPRIDPRIDPRFDPGIDPRVNPGAGPGAGQFGGLNPQAHNPIISFGHNQIVSGHNLVVSGHNPLLSGHNPIISGHSPFVSRHHPALSGHSPFISTPHNLIESFGHLPVLSNPHNFVSSRFGGLDPIRPGNPGLDPQMQQFGGSGPGHSAFVSFGHSTIDSGHGVQQSIGHLPFQSGMHGIFNSSGHSSFISTGHIPWVSSTHSPFLSSHNPIVSGHGQALSGHNPIFSGHSPIASGHEPFLSAPHAPSLSSPHGFVQSQGHIPVLSFQPHSIVGSRFDPTGPIAVDPTLPNSQGAMPGQGEIEQVPGNRGIRIMPGLPPGDPYTVPQQ